MYGTNKDVFDSDGDTYSDKQELVNLYNPAGNAPITLIESGVVKDYENPENNYLIHYPTNWTIQTTDDTKQETIFTSQSGEFIEVMVLDNEQGLEPTQWFEQQQLSSRIDEKQVIKTRSGLTGIKSIDRRTVYIFNGDKVYVIIHNTANKKQIDFDATFEMMTRSLRIQKIKEEPVEEQSEQGTTTTNNESQANGEQQNSTNQ